MKTIIRPISELSRNVTSIEKLIIENDVPVHLTKNGINHMVILNSQQYDRMIEKMETYEKILRAEAEIREGKAVPEAQAMEMLETFKKGIIADGERISG